MRRWSVYCYQSQFFEKRKKYQKVKGKSQLKSVSQLQFIINLDNFS
jgi:hypothetical protein